MLGGINFDSARPVDTLPFPPKFYGGENEMTKEEEAKQQQVTASIWHRRPLGFLFLLLCGKVSSFCASRETSIFLLVFVLEHSPQQPFLWSVLAKHNTTTRGEQTKEPTMHAKRLSSSPSSFSPPLDLSCGESPHLPQPSSPFSPGQDVFLPPLLPFVTAASRHRVA